VFSPGFFARSLAFVLFLIAAFSDLWDGYLARKHGWISDFGKLVDPIADKLLLVATFVPFYILSHRDEGVGKLPLWGDGSLPLWIVVVIFGREALITAIRALAARKGIVIPAGRAGKYKAVIQNIFIGAALVWYALQTLAQTEAWSGSVWSAWQVFHGTVVIITLLAALILTVYSMVVYLVSWRSVLRAVT
jgi:CDP-diacylglycerol--glycerol-3-phosphate 3-phosphatidyltransferase